MGKKIYTNELGRLTNMATMPIYGKNLKKIFFSRSNRPMILKLGMLHCLCDQRSRSLFDLGQRSLRFQSKMFDFGLYTQVSDSGPHGPLV